MSNKARKFKSNRKSNFRRVHFDRYGHLKRIKSLTPEVMERNLENVIDLNNEPVDLASFLLSDPANEPNVVIADDLGVEVSEEARQEAEQAMVQTAINEVSQEVLANDEEQSFSSARFLRSVKFSWRRNINNLKEEGKSFFSKMRDCFANKSPVRGASILAKYRASKDNLKVLTQYISRNAPTAKTKILNNKYVRRFEMAATVSFAALVMACSNGNKQPAQMAELPAQDSLTINDVPLSADTLGTDSIDFAQAQQQAQNDSIVFTPFNARSPLHQFCEKTFANIGGWEGVNKALTNDIMQTHFEGKTRDEVLNAMRFVLSKPSFEVANGEEYKVASALASYLNDCDENAQFPENVSKIFIEQFKGNLNVQVTSANPCDQTIKTKRLNTVRRQPAAVAEPVQQEPVQQQADSVEVKGPLQTEFDIAPSSLKQDTVYQQTVVTDSITLTQFKSNEDLNAKDVNEAKPDEVLGLNTDNTKVNIENKQTEFVDADASSPSLGITEFKGNNLSDAQTIREDVPVEEVKNLAPAATDVNIEKSVSSPKQTSFVDVDPSYTYTSTASAEANDSIKTPASLTQTAFVDVTPSFTSTATADSLSNDSIVTPSLNIDAQVSAGNIVSGDSVTVKILADSDTISVGTPAAGYVAERGGFENRGLSKKDIDYAREKLGNETYEQIVENSPAEWFAKGGIAEGLTPDQLAYITAVIAVTDGKNSTTAKFLMNEGDCDGIVLSKVKEDIDGVHKNKTRDGWVYSKRIYVASVRNNGCDKQLTLKQWRTRRQRPTTASGPKFDRYFEQRGVPPRQTAFEEAPSSLTLNYQTVQDVQQEPLSIERFKSNEDLMPRKAAQATAQEVLDLEAENTKVLVENPTVTKRKAAAQRKHNAKVAARYEKQAKEAGLSGNMALDSHQDQGAEFIRSFLDKNKNVKAEDIIDYQAAVRQAYIDAVQSRKA